MLAKITVADYMTKHLVTLTKETNIFDAIKKLLAHRITSAPVLDQHGHLVGMFSENDVMRVVAENVYDQGMGGKVGEFMTKDVIRIESDAFIVDVAEKFQQSKDRSFPVFEDTDLVGIVSRTDVLRALASLES